jgi:tRNA dimethylallyltransferase
LRDGLSPLPQADATLRVQLDAEIAQHGIEHLHAKLAQVDAETAARLHATDTQRVQRAMEIFLVSGKPMSELIKHQEQNPLPYDLTLVALIPSDRAVLHQRIAFRFAEMMKNGLVDELRGLRDKYTLHRDMTSMRCVGYRQAWEFMEGEISKFEFSEKGIAATRQLAKRQLTWLRSMPSSIELDCLSPDLTGQVAHLIETK